VLVKRRETLSVERRADTKRNEEHSKELAQAAVHEGSPVVVFDRTRGLQAKTEIILQHSLSLAMLDWNSFWSGTELSHTSTRK